MTRAVVMFGRNSLNKAHLHVQKHSGKNLVILMNSRKRIAVCSPHMAQALKANGFQLIDA